MKVLLKKIEEFLTKDSGKSSLRLNVTTMVQISNLSFLIVILVTSYKILRGTAIDLIGIAVILGAITAYAGTALWGKNAGKKNETEIKTE